MAHLEKTAKTCLIFRHLGQISGADSCGNDVDIVCYEQCHMSVVSRVMNSESEMTAATDFPAVKYSQLLGDISSLLTYLHPLTAITKNKIRNMTVMRPVTADVTG